MNKNKLILGAAMVGAAFMGGSALSVLAATSTPANSASTTAAATADQPDRDPSQGGHVGTNGTKEELLTGDTATKVKAAALAAVPGGTVERVENDAEGAVYEAHMTKSDGSQVTVKFDANFKVTATEAGHGGGSH